LFVPILNGVNERKEFLKARISILDFINLNNRVNTFHTYYQVPPANHLTPNGH
jgi:hypothetical protein